MSHTKYGQQNFTIIFKHFINHNRVNTILRDYEGVELWFSTLTADDNVRKHKYYYHEELLIRTTT